MTSQTTQSIPEVQAVITASHVKQVLDAYLFGQRLRKDHPLLSLMVVEKIVSDPSFPPCIDERSYALVTILLAIIEQQLARHRRAAGTALAVSETNLTDAMMAIRRDWQTMNPELLFWNWLYYHYVRVEFGVQKEAFCSACGNIHKRTLRRFQDRGLQRVVQVLIDEEWDARRNAERAIHSIRPSERFPAIYANFGLERIS